MSDIGNIMGTNRDVAPIGILGADSQRRALIFSTTFYPDPNVASIRVTRWCRHLPDHGWKPYVFCRNYGFNCSSRQLAENVHPEVTLEYLNSTGQHVTPDMTGTVMDKDPVWKAARSFAARTGISTLFVPDPAIWFWRAYRSHILNRVREIRPHVIITTSPKHAVHDIGLWISTRTGIPWIADFRDPHLFDNRFKPAGLGLLRWGAHVAFDKSIYKQAQLITHAIPVHARWARLRHPFARQRVRTLMNGFPSEMLAGCSPGTKRTVGRQTICVVGTILDPQKLQLAHAVAQLVDEGLDLELLLIGKPPSDAGPFRRLLGDRYVATGYVTHRQAVRFVAAASVLVDFADISRSESWQLCLKLFEYIASGHPIVSINPSRPNQRLLRNVSNARMLWKPDIADVTQALRDAVHEPVGRDPVELVRFHNEFSWANHVQKLAHWLDELVSIHSKPNESV